ncbi:group III truncated hemoglobin [Hymenobacter antarcticus]|uniref:Hemoglobin n=1 Tax=Hymenobacter antarcticus TaxID=486270 RepID=A0ABP7Q5I6_9BACT
METSEKTDIREQDDIRRLIDAFYTLVRQDELLGPVFAARIPDGHWPTHLDTMTRFWTAALLGQAAGYRGNPGAKHMYLPIEKAHFTRWLALFSQTVDALFAGENAAEMKVRALKMGEMFQAKIASARANGGLSIL